MTPIRTLRPLAKVVLSTQSDERLVALSRDGSEDAFAEIVRRHRPGLLRLARSLGSGDRADDVVQDGLVRAWRALRRSDAEIDLRPWLTTIVRNRALTAHSTTRLHEELDETIDGVRQPGDIVIMREELRSAVSAVNSLPESQREALVRSALAGESHDQIASALATTPGAVRQLIFRARTGLREAVGAIVPFPVVRALADLGAGGAAVGAGATLAAAGGGGIGLKAVAIVAVGAAVAGSGVAIDRHSSGAEAKEPTRTTATQARDQASAAPDSTVETTSDSTSAQRSVAGTDAVEPVAEKGTAASPSLALDPADSSEAGSPRVAEADADEPAPTAADEQSAPPEQHGSHQQPAAQQPPSQQPHHQPGPGGHSGGGDQPPPPPPTSAPPPETAEPDHHDGVRTHDGHHDGDGHEGQGSFIPVP